MLDSPHLLDFSVYLSQIFPVQLCRARQSEFRHSSQSAFHTQLTTKRAIPLHAIRIRIYFLVLLVSNNNTNWIITIEFQMCESIYYCAINDCFVFLFFFSFRFVLFAHIFFQNLFDFHLLFREIWARVCAYIAFIVLTWYFLCLIFHLNVIRMSCTKNIYRILLIWPTM